MKTSEVQCFARRAILTKTGRRVEVRFAEVNGRLECVGLEIGPPVNDAGRFWNVKDGDLAPIAAAELRFPFRQFVDVALQHAVMDRQGTGDFQADVRAFAEDMDKLAVAKAEPRKRPGRPAAYGRDHFQEVARIYREHNKAGGRAPTKAVQEHFTVTKSTAAKWVARARELEELERIGGNK